MINTFYEHHVKYISKSEIIENGIIFLDANALLNLYRLSNENREKLFEILENVKDRLYLSNQVGKEFYKNRTKVMYMKQNLKSGLIKELSKDIETILNKVENVNFTSKYKGACNLLKHEHTLKNEIVNKLIEMKECAINTIKEYDISINNDTYSDRDEILDKIVKLFDGKVIQDMSEDDLNKIYTEGKNRYDKKIPPGYEDVKEKDEPECYGDLVIWNELINFSKEKKSNILFVSDDRKEDWCKLLTKFGQEDNKKGKKIDFGTRPDLIKEFKEKTDQLFYSVTTEEFIKSISKLCEIDNTKGLEEESEIIREELQSSKIKHKLIEYTCDLNFEESTLGKYNEEDKVKVEEVDYCDWNKILNYFEIQNKILDQHKGVNKIIDKRKEVNKMLDQYRVVNKIIDQLEKQKEIIK